MRDFKIREIKNEYSRFVVEIEFLDNQDRRKFGYPMNEGWDVLFDGKPKFAVDIARIIADEEEADKVDFADFKKFEGLKVSEKDIKKPAKRKIDPNSCKKG